MHINRFINSIKTFVDDDTAVLLKSRNIRFGVSSFVGGPFQGRAAPGAWPIIL